MSNTTFSADEAALQQEILTWYRQQALEVPAEQLDQDILQLAQAHLAEMHQGKITPIEPPNSVWRRHPWALSSVASLVLIVGLLMLNRPQIEDTLTLSPMTMSAPAPQTMTRMADSQAIPSSNRQAEAIVEHQKQTQKQQDKAASAAIEPQQDAMSPAMVASSIDPMASVSEIHKTSLAESLQRLQALIDAKDTVQAIVVEQQLVKDYPQLVAEDINPAQLSQQQLALRLEFKKLQQQLHQLAK
ncbi:hypothetical protein L5L55_15770 [Shewanella glacialipiscicola]|uniref:hypothetical protein n=1 Tax=Shewanella glacialipiscicola TaxID=614069 RepID=UPI0021DA2ACD|nr:hypothetical protein [Shewanella glacialipiscicola]MCU7996332.1 hypothetical protein [Shewanella glacialipiscicola]MCU8027645.1 hypothetical protein [Shewanella glacialipiscicola]